MAYDVSVPSVVRVAESLKDCRAWPAAAGHGYLRLLSLPVRRRVRVGNLGFFIRAIEKLINARLAAACSAREKVPGRNADAVMRAVGLPRITFFVATSRQNPFPRHFRPGPNRLSKRVPRGFDTRLLAIGFAVTTV
jgi:hypothetical protein